MVVGLPLRAGHGRDHRALAADLVQVEELDLIWSQSGHSYNRSCNLFVMERNESNFLLRAYILANASAGSGTAKLSRCLGDVVMG